METMYYTTTSHDQRLTVPFVLWTIVVFVCISRTLYALDVVPETVVQAETVPDVATATTSVQSIDTVASVAPIEARMPVRVTVPSVGIDAPVLAPTENSVAVLDRALLSGAVHYPDSALAGDRGNMLLFGHSSYLPIVKNKAFRTFNALGTITLGSPVYVYSTTYRYTYLVTDVHEAKADDEHVSFDGDVSTLTLVTCNTFGSKEDRWVVRAELAGIDPIPDTERVVD